MQNFPLLHFEILVMLYLTGFGFVSIFVPNDLKKIALWIAPLYGTILIAFLGTAASFGRLPMNQGVYLINFIVLFLFLYALITKKFTFIFSKKSLLMWFFLFVLSPFFSLSWNNSSLLTSSNFLIKHIVLDTYPFNRTFADNNYLVGVSSVIAYFSVLLRQDASVIVRILPNVYLSIFFPLVFILIKHVNIIMRLILSGLFYLMLKFFPPTFPQFLCILIFLSMIILVREYFLGIRSGKIAAHFNTFDLLNALFFSSLAMVYPPGFRLAVVAFLLLTIISLFLKKDRWLITLSIIKVIILAILINPVAVGLAFV